jgi:hypothetical protein
LRLEQRGYSGRKASEGKGGGHRAEARAESVGAARALAFALDGDRGRREACLEGGERADFQHIADRRETGVTHGLEALDLIREHPGELAADVERAAAHAGDGAHALHARVGEFAEDHALARAEGVAEDAGDLHGEGLRVAALEDGPDLALHTRLQFDQRQDRRVGRLGAQAKRTAGDQGEETEEIHRQNDDGPTGRFLRAI